jgi:GT2 family glycosyltransferase
MNLTIVIPFFNGHAYLTELLESLPIDIPVIIVDDQSDVPVEALVEYRTAPTRIVRPKTKRYFSGAVNVGISECNTDVLVLNQDTWFSGRDWLKVIEDNSDEYDMIGERIRGSHPAHPDGYIHGTFMWMSRVAINEVGLLNEDLYPLWGSTCEWQLRLCRRDFKPLILDTIPDFHHVRPDGVSVGDSIVTVIADACVKTHHHMLFHNIFTSCDDGAVVCYFCFAYT